MRNDSEMQERRSHGSVCAAALALTSLLPGCSATEPSGGEDGGAESSTLPADCNRDDSSRRYVSFGSNSCEDIDIKCDVGEVAFDDPRCGCGCRTVPEGWDQFCDVAGREYRGTAFECRNLSLQCENGSTGFSDECGCGCFSLPDSCKSPNRRYVTEGRGSCAGADVICDSMEVGFEDDCGCGCELEE